MKAVDVFLGEVVARTASRLIAAGHSGIRLQNTSAFSCEAFLENITSSPKPRVAAVVGSTAQELSRKGRYPAKLLTTDLAVAAEWRNDPKVTETVVVVALGEEERLGTFHRFTEVQDHDLYKEICALAKATLCPNDVQTHWWAVLARPEAMRQLSVHRLASYFVFLESQPKQIPEASRDGLYLLGLLPSKGFFERSTPAELLRNFNANRQLINRIEILSNADRDRLGRGVDSATDAERPRLLATLGKVLKYNRSGEDADRAVLLAEDVRALFEAKKTSTKTKGSRPVPIERVGIDAILHGETEELIHLGEKLRDTLKTFEENETPSVAIDLSGRSEQASMKIPPALVRLLSRSVTPDKLGGIFKFADSDSFADAIDDIDQAEFSPFGLDGEKSTQTLLKRVVDAELIEPEAFDRWLALVSTRAALTEDAPAIAVSPIVALASDKNLLKAASDYLAAYENFMATIRDRYEAVSVKSAKGARHLCAQLLLLDVILFQTGKAVYAMLSPLHPLHLWKFVRLAEQLRDEKDTLSDEYKEVLGASAQRLPHFVTALFIPEGPVSNHTLVLPQSTEFATLPCYQEESPHFAGDEGQEKVLRILRKFLVLYPHAKKNLRVCLVDPPELSSLLEQLANEISGEDLPIDGLELTVLRTLDRSLSLGSDDQQLEAIAAVFGAEDLPRFTLNIHHEKTTYTDILAQLRQSPVHVLAIFDPSRSEVGQFVSRETGFVHPLVLPKQFSYDPIEDTLVITPAATGDLFDLYYSLQNRLNNALTGSHFGVSSSLASEFPPTGELLKCCTWLVLGDKLVESLPVKGGKMISFEPGVRRDIIVLTDSLTKFEREFDYYLRKANLDPTEESLHELIGSSSELVGEGLLGLIRSDGDE
ncbi:MAG: hypothetical protein ABMA15_01385 [Vicinamibacterales bacterium]